MGAYLISIDAKNKIAKEKKERLHRELISGDPELAVESLILENEQKRASKGCIVVELARSILSFKAGLYIMGVSICW